MADKKTCMNCIIKKDSLFDELSHVELAQLESRRKELQYRKGEIIYKEGTEPVNLLCLNSGNVKIVKSQENGNDIIISLLKPVNFIGFNSLVAEKEYNATAIALTDSGICSIHKDDFFNVLKKNSALSLKIITRQAEELTKLNTHFVNLTHKNMKERLCDILLMLMKIFGTDKTGKIKIQLKRKELAALSNMTTSNVIRTLSVLAKEKYIDIIGKDIIIKDIDSLQKISKF